jgi:hypothetical protein
MPRMLTFILRLLNHLPLRFRHNVEQHEELARKLFGLLRGRAKPLRSHFHVFVIPKMRECYMNSNRNGVSDFDSLIFSPASVRLSNNQITKAWHFAMDLMPELLAWALPSRLAGCGMQTSAARRRWLAAYKPVGIDCSRALKRASAPSRIRKAVPSTAKSPPQGMTAHVF